MKRPYERAPEDDADGLDGLPDEDLQAALMQEVRTRGAVVAYRTCTSICSDPKAPANAKATAANTLFRVGGFFEAKDEGAGKDLADMSIEELRAESARAHRKLEALRQRSGAAPRREGGGIFD